MNHPPEREVIPEELAPGDPCSGDEALFEPGDFANFVRFGGALDEGAWAETERAFHDRVLAVLQGEAPWDDPELLRLAALLRVDHPAHVDTRPLRVAERAVPDEVLCDIVEDLIPDYAVLAERITGDDRPLAVPVVGALAFVPATADGRRALDWWAEDEDDRALVRAARVIDASAPGIYRDGVPLLACHPRRVPEGPAPRGVYVGRAYRLEEGWAWSCCLVLPRVPDLAVIERRIRLETWRHRCIERRASTDDVLRAHPEVLYRTASELTDR